MICSEVKLFHAAPAKSEYLRLDKHVKQAVKIKGSSVTKTTNG